MQSNLNHERDSESRNYRRLYLRRWHGLELDSRPVRIDGKRAKRCNRVTVNKGDWA